MTFAKFMFLILPTALTTIFIISCFIFILYVHYVPISKDEPKARYIIAMITILVAMLISIGISNSYCKDKETEVSTQEFSVERSGTEIKIIVADKDLELIYKKEVGYGEQDLFEYTYGDYASDWQQVRDEKLILTQETANKLGLIATITATASNSK